MAAPVGQKGFAEVMLRRREVDAACFGLLAWERLPRTAVAVEEIAPAAAEQAAGSGRSLIKDHDALRIEKEELFNVLTSLPGAAAAPR